MKKKKAAYILKPEPKTLPTPMLDTVEVLGNTLLITNKGIFLDNGVGGKRIPKRMLVSEIKRRPHFYNNPDLSTITIFVEVKLYNEIMGLIDSYRNKKGFGIADFAKVWKIAKPLIEDAFSDEPEPVTKSNSFIETKPENVR